MPTKHVEQGFGAKLYDRFVLNLCQLKHGTTINSFSI